MLSNTNNVEPSTVTNPTVNTMPQQPTTIDLDREIPNYMQKAEQFASTQSSSLQESFDNIKNMAVSFLQNGWNSTKQSFQSVAEDTSPTVPTQQGGKKKEKKKGRKKTKRRLQKRANTKKRNKK